MNRYLIIGRTVGREGGFEFQWRDADGVLPNDDERAVLIAGMNAVHHDVFGVNSQRTALVALPEWRDQKWWKLPVWREGAEAGRYGLHVIDDDEGEDGPATAPSYRYPDGDDSAGTVDHNRRA